MVATPLGQALAPRTGPTAVAPVAGVASSSLAVSSSTSALTVATSVPAGTKVAQISLFAVNTLEKRTSAESKRRGLRHIGTVLRKTTTAKRYVFRLTGKHFRHLKPGRYLVQVRVGASRTTLGPAVTREVTVARTRSKIAR